MFWFDPMYFIIMLPAIVLVGWAQLKVQSTFKRFSTYGSVYRLTGASVAREILNRYGLSNVKVEPVAGELTDHYDPRSKTLRLSEAVYSSNSLAALGVAAHEAGHALQHAQGYAPLALRSAVVPVAGFGSQLGPMLVILGVVFSASGFGGMLINLGILTFTAAVLFSLITLPVEFNASKRALAILTQDGLIAGEEYQPVKQVLQAAALTYVAAAVYAIMQLIYLLMLSDRRR